MKFGDATMIDHMQFDGLTCPFETWAMGCAADFIAGKFKISRAEQDRYAAIASAGSAGMERVLLQGGSVAVEPPSSSARRKAWRRMKAFVDSTADGLAKLKPAFGKEGSVTAGNASQISDGAAAVVVASLKKARRLSAKPMARIVDYCTARLGKEIFDAPTHGLRTLMERNKLTPKDVDLFEINEAFAAQILTNITQLGIPEDKLNICGGGTRYPIGGSSARVLTTLLHQMQRTGAKAAASPVPGRRKRSEHARGADVVLRSSIRMTRRHLFHEARPDCSPCHLLHCGMPCVNR